jgi:hypothetical protein
MTISLVLLLISSDFPVCQADDNQFYPVVAYANDQFYVFWEDRRLVTSDTLYCVFGARITSDGVVIDSGGKRLFANAVHYDIDAAFDGTNFLVAFEDSC